MPHLMRFFPLYNYSQFMMWINEFASERRIQRLPHILVDTNLIFFVFLVSNIQIFHQTDLIA